MQSGLHKSRLLFALLSAVLLLTANANARPAKTPTHSFSNFMRLFDANKDGKVTKKEFEKAAKVRFHDMDTNKSRHISHQEFISYVLKRRLQRREKFFHRIDKDGDQHVSKAEYLEAMRKRALRRFARLDANADGRISKLELKQHRPRRLRRIRSFANRIFKRLDQNKDGNISQQESLRAWSNWFKRLDKNGDKLVTGQDLGSQ